MESHISHFDVEHIPVEELLFQARYLTIDLNGLRELLEAFCASISQDGHHNPASQHQYFLQSLRGA